MRVLAVSGSALVLALLAGCIVPEPEVPPVLEISDLNVAWTCGGPRTAEITFLATNISNRTLTKVAGESEFKQGHARDWGSQQISSLVPGESQRFKTIITNEFWCETKDRIQLKASASAADAPAVRTERTIRSPA